MIQLEVEVVEPSTLPVQNITMINNTFTSNSAGYEGGGAKYSDNSCYANIIMIKNTFTRNSVSSGRGGAISDSSPYVNIRLEEAGPYTLGHGPCAHCNETPSLIT